jgi:hypothetical protein
VRWTGLEPATAEEVLALPDCPDCLRQSSVRSLTPGPFSPVTRVVSLPPRFGAQLPEMLWLCGQETVGAGGAYDEDPERGEKRALHEALERYAAHFTPLPASPRGVLFQSSAGGRWLSRKRALLTEPGSISTGLACRETLQDAIADALREVCERDALARFWLSLQSGECGLRKLEGAAGAEQVGGSQQLAGGQPAGSDQQVGGGHQQVALQAYQLDSYLHPTVLCVGRTGAGQVTTGTACGPLSEALRKALAECLQNVFYLRTYCRQANDPPLSFADHAGLYWLALRQFPDLDPLCTDAVPVRRLPPCVLHCDLTPPDLRLLGLHAVRVQVPGLLHLPMRHQDWPELLSECGSSLSPPELPHPFA